MSRLLQFGALPRRDRGGQDPNAPLALSACKKASSSIAMPSEAYQFDIAYNAFRADKEFWRHWKVVDCARSHSEESFRQETATIRVVLDMPSTQRLFPTAYTPGFLTLPFGTVLEDDHSEPRTLTWVVQDALPEVAGELLDIAGADARSVEDMKSWCQENGDCVGFAYCPATGAWEPRMRDTGFDPRTAEWNSWTRDGETWQWYYLKERAEARPRQRAIAGLPPGYSVALDVHTLEQARLLLKHQRDFRGGQIDPKYEWLDAIVKRADVVPQVKPQPRAKQKINKMKMLAQGPEQNQPWAVLRRPVGTPVENSEPGYSDKLKSFSDDYGDSARVAEHVGMGKEHVALEVTLIDAFGGNPRLPPRESDSGSWSGPFKKSAFERQQDEQEGLALDRQLERLLERTAEGPRGNKGGGGLLAGRLDR